MLSNITSNPQQETDRGQLYREGDLVYLYGDRAYTGKLIRPIERTYPIRWTVRLDRGGYEAVDLNCVSIIKSDEEERVEPDSEISFSDESDSEIEKLKKEIVALKTHNARLQQENEMVRKDLDIAKQIIRRAKNITPLARISLKRVLRLAHDACMDVQRTVGGWILRMGDKARKFRRLADIWDLLSVDEFILSEIFPKDKLVAIDLIRPPKRRKTELPEKKTFPLIHPEDIIRNRTMLLVKPDQIKPEIALVKGRFSTIDNSIESGERLR